MMIVFLKNFELYNIICIKGSDTVSEDFLD